jgi:Ricin-type beta-trefoil lectin domain-like
MSNQITNVNSGLGLAVNGASTTKGTEIVQWPPPGDNPSNLLWKLVGVGSNQFQIVNVNSGLGLAVDGASTTKGAEIVQWPPPGDNPSNLLWKLVQPTLANQFQIVNVNSGLGLAVDGASTTKGAEIIQWPTPGDNPSNLLWQFNVEFTVTVGAGEFSFTGTGFVPGSTVQVTSSFQTSFGSPLGGGPYTYTVAADGSFGDSISVDYFESAGSLTVKAVDLNQPAPFTKVWSGPAGG